PSSKQELEPEPEPKPEPTAAPLGAGAQAPPAEGLTTEAPQKPRKKATTPIADSEIRQAVKHWAPGFERLRGEKPPILWPRACGQFAPVLKALKLEGTKAMLDRFFASTDRVVQRSDYSTGAFVAMLTRLAGKTPPGNGDNGKTATMLR